MRQCWRHGSHELKETRRQFVFTHFARFSSDTWHTALVCHTRRKHNDVDSIYGQEGIEQLDTENGDIRCSLGYSYRPGTGYNPAEDASGRYLPLRPMDNDLLGSSSGVDEDANREEDGEHEAFHYSGSGCHDCLDGGYDCGVRWVVARDPNSHVYCWQERVENCPEAEVNANGKEIEAPSRQEALQSPHCPAQYTSPKFKTETWRFRYQNGETAIVECFEEKPSPGLTRDGRYVGVRAYNWFGGVRFVN